MWIETTLTFTDIIFLVLFFKYFDYKVKPFKKKGAATCAMFSGCYFVKMHQKNKRFGAELHKMTQIGCRCHCENRLSL